MSRTRPVFLLTAALCALPLTLAAQDSPAPSIALELNNAADIQQTLPAAEGAAPVTQTSCRMTYVVTNRTGEGLRAAGWQVGVFDSGGVVRALLMLNFGELPDGKTKIGIFDIPGWPCADISRIVVNDVAQCVPASAEPVTQADGTQVWAQASHCLDGLATSTRADIEFGL